MVLLLTFFTSYFWAIKSFQSVGKPTLTIYQIPLLANIFPKVCTLKVSKCLASKAK